MIEVREAGVGANRNPPHILYRMEIKYKTFPNNPRFISDEEMLQLGESMGDFGSLDGIVVNTSPGLYEGAVISGNQKSTQIGIENLSPKITKRYKTPTKAGTVAYGHIEFMGELFPYREVYWSENKCEVANLRANNFGGHNDVEMLRTLPEHILVDGGIDIDMEVAMFNVLKGFMPADAEDGQGYSSGPVTGANNPFDDEGIEGKNSYGVIIMCATEEEQKSVFEKMQGDGFTCKIVVV